MLANYLLARGGRKQGLFTHSGSASSAFFSFEQVLNRQIGSTAKNAENTKENLGTTSSGGVHKFAGSQDGACRKSKPAFLLFALSAFSVFFAV